MNDKEFIDNVFDIAFGEGAIDKEYTKEEVINKLIEFSDLALDEEFENGW